jgi:hypothetical protein
VETRVRTEPKNIYIVMDNEENMHPATLVTDNPGGPDLAVVMLREPTTKREAIYLSPYTNSAKVRNQSVYSVGFPGSSEVFLEGKQAYSSGPDMVSVRQGLLDHEVTAVQSGSRGTLLLTDVAKKDWRLIKPPLRPKDFFRKKTEKTLEQLSQSSKSRLKATSKNKTHYSSMSALLCRLKEPVKLLLLVVPSSSLHKKRLL